MAQMIDLAQRVRSVIVDNRYLTMAISNGSDVWIAPLAYSVESDYSFIYYSSKKSVHSVYIKQNPIVACSIYNSSLSSDDVDGIQFKAKVEQVRTSELVKVVPEYFRQSFPIPEIRKRWKKPIESFKDLATQRFYRIKPINMYTIDLEYTEEDRRVEVDLKILSELIINK